MKDRVSDKPRGFGFVTFIDEAVADKVCEEKHELQGRQVRPHCVPAGVKHLPAVPAGSLKPANNLVCVFR